MLSLLRKNKNSWPFLDPVDPIAMGIPQYKDIVGNPMDLSTVQRNLASKKYTTVTQFYGDIKLIINNSYTFNKNNLQYETITREFEKYFEHLKSKTIVITTALNSSNQNINGNTPKVIPRLI
jgi:hypothetical protein